MTLANIQYENNLPGLNKLSQLNVFSSLGHFSLPVYSYDLKLQCAVQFSSLQFKTSSINKKHQVVFDIEQFLPCHHPKLNLNFGKVLINETKSLIFYVYNGNP